MILYRAITSDDFNEIQELGKINCTLYHSYRNLENCKNIEMTKKMYNICYQEKNKKDILSFIYGHISGKLVGSAKRSPWISLTSSYESACKYANLNERRSILCFEVEDDIIINDIIDLKTKDILNGAILKLSNGELIKYRDNGIIIPYGEQKDKTRNSKSFTFVNYSKSDSEYLICYNLEPKKYFILNPENQKLFNNRYGKKVPDIIKMILNDEKKEEKVKTK